MNDIAKKLRQAYHSDLTDVPLLLDAAEEIEKLKFQIEHLEACVTIHDRNRKELKAQVERLLAKEAARITSVSQIYHRLLREKPNSNKDLMAEAERLQPDLPENPFNERKDHE